MPSPTALNDTQQPRQDIEKKEQTSTNPRDQTSDAVGCKKTDRPCTGLRFRFGASPLRLAALAIAKGHAPTVDNRKSLGLVLLRAEMSYLKRRTHAGVRAAFAYMEVTAVTQTLKRKGSRFSKPGTGLVQPQLTSALQSSVVTRPLTMLNNFVLDRLFCHVTRHNAPYRLVSNRESLALGA